MVILFFFSIDNPSKSYYDRGRGGNVLCFCSSLLWTHSLLFLYRKRKKAGCQYFFSMHISHGAWATYPASNSPLTDPASFTWSKTGKGRVWGEQGRGYLVNFNLPQRIFLIPFLLKVLYPAFSKSTQKTVMLLGTTVFLFDPVLLNHFLTPVLTV